MSLPPLQAPGTAPIPKDWGKRKRSFVGDAINRLKVQDHAAIMAELGEH